MDFSKIQARGVSRLLLRGEKFSAPPNMKRISIFDRWRWQGHHVEYLDASCLLFAQDGRFIEAVDWDDLRSRGTKMAGAVSHSGDQMDDVAQQGTHEINIKLDDLGKIPSDPSTSSATILLVVADILQLCKIMI